MRTLMVSVGCVLLAAALLLGVAGQIGCPASLGTCEVGDSGDITKACPNKNPCVDGVCVPCSEKQPCPLGNPCLNGVCQAFLSCKDNSDCNIGEFCDLDDNLCKSGCNKDDDCPKGQSCFQNQCKKAVCGPRAEPPTPLNEPCYSGDAKEVADAIVQGGGQCRRGTHDCIDNGQAWSLCYEDVRASDKEICDGVDNNCNGSVDELAECKETCVLHTWRPCSTAPSKTRLASSGTPSRCDSGIQYCVPTKDDASKGSWGACLKQRLPLLVKKEIDACYIDDGDCDGVADSFKACKCDPKTDTKRSCYTGPKDTEGKGECLSGEQSCEKGCLIKPKDGETCPGDLVAYRWSACVKSVLPIPEEKAGCNGKDDDCDGQIDNRSDDPTKPLREPCYPEQSKGCDADGGGACKGGCLGECGCGFRICKDGRLGLCEGATTPTAETCNKKDDDCNGKVDDGITCD